MKIPVIALNFPFEAVVQSNQIFICKADGDQLACSKIECEQRI